MPVVEEGEDSGFGFRFFCVIEGGLGTLTDAKIYHEAIY